MRYKHSNKYKHTNWFSNYRETGNSMLTGYPDGENPYYIGYINQWLHYYMLSWLRTNDRLVKPNEVSICNPIR